MHGSPLEGSAVHTFKIFDALKACFEVGDVNYFVMIQSEAAIREIASRYPYDTIELDEPCLRKPTEDLKNEMKQNLQNRVTLVGVKILTFEISDVGYEKRMEEILLVNQKAQANLDATKKIVEGVSGIALQTIQKLEEEGLKLSEEKKSEVIMNLLLIKSNNTNGDVNLFLGQNKLPY